MRKQTKATNPSPAIPERLHVALGNLHAVIEVMMVLRDRDQLGTIAEIIADQIARRMSTVERAMKGRR